MKLVPLLAALFFIQPLAVPAETKVAEEVSSSPWPSGDYGKILITTLGAAEGTQDFSALRRAYAASPDYTGVSRIVAAGAEVQTWTFEQQMAAILADFPLIDTQAAAVELFKARPGKSAARMVASHQAFKRALLASILAEEEKTDEGRRFRVLSVGEEQAVLKALKLKPVGQSRIEIDGLAHDVIETAQGPVLFDISAFYGKAVD